MEIPLSEAQLYSPLANSLSRTSLCTSSPSIFTLKATKSLRIQYYIRYIVILQRTKDM